MEREFAEKLIAKAKKLLWENPFDAIHDSFHHYKVWENAINIIYVEKINCDINLLEVAIWWHDLSKTDQNNLNGDDFSDLEISTKQFGLSDSELKLLKQIIVEHQTAGIQSSIESKILFDADKIEYVSIPRILIATKNLSNEIRAKYETKYKAEDIKKKFESLNYDYSRKTFLERWIRLQTYGRNLFLNPSYLDAELQ